MKFGAVKYHGHVYKFYFNILPKLLNLAMVLNIEVMLGQKAKLLCVKFCNFLAF
jgi:hypothetical protein